jgi:hypothetical protein
VGRGQFLVVFGCFFEKKIEISENTEGYYTVLDVKFLIEIHNLLIINCL